MSRKEGNGINSVVVVTGFNCCVNGSGCHYCSVMKWARTITAKKQMRLFSRKGENVIGVNHRGDVTCGWLQLKSNQVYV